MSEKYWYQEGWLVIWLFVFACVASFIGHASYQNAQLNALPNVTSKITGKLNQPLWGSPSLEIKVWHQHPATLRNVVLFMNLNEDPARGEMFWAKREHSFEAWQPNEEQAVKFTFPLKRFDPKQETHVVFMLLGKTINPYISNADWLSPSHDT